MSEDFNIRYFNKILNNIKHVYFESLDNKKRFWRYAEYDFLYRVLRESSEIKNDNQNIDNYDCKIQSYFDGAIQARLKYGQAQNLVNLKGKILLFDVHSTMFDR
ncbi:hypothetical protein F991_01925 [Acinetobacter sp. CIP-A165]|uniref:hypothetical protein n=1 Tax=Acinetobacter sp. CIP-A165 TaxID=40373 RepID=UPI0002D097BE|nr:hypothetical protein [Acinetobacter sp. CIP-A165]ENU30126.1 hypothetical protein F991_01925 [Acinetobacter sp. CIP-A165]